MLSNNNIGAYDKNPDKCPLCHSFITPNLIHAEMHRNNNARVVYRCTNWTCWEIFIAYFKRNIHNRHQCLTKVSPCNYVNIEFDNEIKEVSSDFIEIYNQAIKAEAIWLDKIAWVWFRKSLEFLIKDYVILIFPDDEEQVKADLLWKVINEKIEDDEIKEISKRAVWIWNDETHYVKKWEDKDINDLKILIDIVQSFISKKQKAKKYLENMS